MKKKRPVGIRSSIAGVRIINGMTQSAAGMLPCCHQADIRMCSHRLPRLDYNSATSCQQAWCKLIVKTFYRQIRCKLIVLTTCGKSAYIKLYISSLILTDLIKLNEANKLDAT